MNWLLNLPIAGMAVVIIAASYGTVRLRSAAENLARFPAYSLQGNGRSIRPSIEVFRLRTVDSPGCLDPDVPWRE